MFEKKERKTKEDYLISLATILIGVALIYVLKDHTEGNRFAFLGLMFGMLLVMIGVVSIFTKIT